MLNINRLSHLDHNLSLAHVRFILERFGDRDGFFAETVNLPPELADLPCALHGPSTGQPDVADDEVQMVVRPGRNYPSRVLRNGDVGTLPSRLLTVIAGPHDGLSCLLYTAHGGPLAPREPGDPSLPEDQREASETFWKVHALAPESRIRGT